MNAEHRYVGLCLIGFLVLSAGFSGPWAVPHAPAPAMWWPPQPDRTFGPLPNSSTHDYAEYFGALRRLPEGTDTLAAFYGAVGHGAYALEPCRAKTLNVQRVTNTNESGAGSLKDALNSDGSGNYTIIVFTTGSTTTWSSSLTKSGNCLYIAGQTAPGGGFQITGNRWRIRTETADLVIRYLRWRKGAATLAHVHSEDGDRLYYDHLSVYWADPTSGGIFNISGDTIDGGSALSGFMRNVTVAYSIFAEPDATHPTTLQMVGGPKSEPPNDSMSVWRNYFGGPGRRIPQSVGHEYTLANNIMYNWLTRGTETNNEIHGFQLRNNFFKKGPATSGTSVPLCSGDDCGGEGGDNICHRRIYAYGNRSIENSYASDTDPDSVWRGSKRQLECRDAGGVPADDFDGFQCVTTGDTIPSAWRLADSLSTSGRFPLSVPEITDALRDAILDSVGASRRLNCSGEWVANRDSIDTNRLTWFADSAGPSAGMDWDTISVPTLDAGTPCTDSDSDAMPDSFELAMGYSATGLSASADCGGNGYLNIEEYINGGLDEAGTLTWTDVATNETEYRVYRWQSGSGWSLLQTLGADVESYTVPGGSWAVGDSLKVHAWNVGGGESDASNIVAVTCP